VPIVAPTSMNAPNPNLFGLLGSYTACFFAVSFYIFEDCKYKYTLIFKGCRYVKELSFSQIKVSYPFLLLRRKNASNPNLFGLPDSYPKYVFPCHQ